MKAIDKLLDWIDDIKNQEWFMHTTKENLISEIMAHISQNRSEYEAKVALRFWIRKCHKFEYVEWDYKNSGEPTAPWNLRKELYSADILVPNGDIHVTGWLQRYDSPDDLKKQIMEWCKPLGLMPEFVEESE